MPATARRGFRQNRDDGAYDNIYSVAEPSIARGASGCWCGIRASIHTANEARRLSWDEALRVRILDLGSKHGRSRSKESSASRLDANLDLTRPRVQTALSLLRSPGIFANWFSLRESCPNCGAVFVREEGYFLGGTRST
jgi:hypothetical protein